MIQRYTTTGKKSAKGKFVTFKDYADMYTEKVNEIQRADDEGVYIYNRLKKLEQDVVWIKVWYGLIGFIAGLVIAGISLSL